MKELQVIPETTPKGKGMDWESLSYTKAIVGKWNKTSPHSTDTDS